MTVEDYVALGAAGQSALVTVITAAAPLALVLPRDPVDLNETRWAGALLSPADLDTAGKQRAHAWIVTFAASDDLVSRQVGSIKPVFRYRVQFFLKHEFGTTADNSEKRARAEVLTVQYALAAARRTAFAGFNGHSQLPVRLRLGRLGDTILHRGEGEIGMELNQVIYFG